MFEGVVAYALNKYLGRFVEDLDSEQLNVGIFSGTVHLTDLHLKAEALADLELPIEVKGGCIGKISIDIPWTSLYYEPVLVHVEEVLVLAGPVYDRANDPERDKRLLRALKNRRLALAQPDAPDPAGDKPKGFIENLVTTIVNNVQVSLQNVHIRYEDGVSTGHPMSCGMVLQNLTAVTTNSKWKATQIDSDAKSLFKLLKVESLSLYWNPCCPSNTLVKAQLNSDGWKTLLRRGLQTFSINGEDFDFVVKPISLKTKMILNKSKEAKVPKLLVDFVLQDAASQLSREQLLSMYELQQSFELSSMGFRFRRYFSGLTAKGQAARCWHEAYRAVTEEYVRPYTWARIKEHRCKYRDYKSLYKEHLHHPTDTERRMDLQLLEDSLDLTSILAAREQAKMEIAASEPELVRNVTPRQSWTFWSWFSSSSTSTDSEPDSATATTTTTSPPATTTSEEFVVVGDRGSWWSRMTAEERQRLCEGVGYERGGEAAPPPPNYIGHKLNFTLANCTVSLVGGGREVLVLTLTHFLASLETRPGAKAFKVSARTESLVVEGASVENDLVPILTADNVTSGCNVPHVFALDFEKNPSLVNANYGLNLSVEPMEIVYHKYAVSELLEFLKLPDVGLEPVRRKAQEQLRVLVEAGRSGVASALAKHRTVHLNVDLRSPYFVIPEHGSLQQGGSMIVVDTGRLTIKTDLQADTADAEESTKMEAEERLYDRFNVALSDIQVLFSDSGEEWRSAKLMSESEMHLVPKARLAVVFSNSVRPDCRTLPRQKLNISIPSLKLNLSDRRVSMIAEFLHSLPLQPAPADLTDAAKVLAKSRSDHQLCSHAIRDPNGPDLQVVWKCLHRGKKSKPEETPEVKQQQTKGVLQRAASASDHSDSEEASDAAAEQWARLVDLPGFEDNVSASNCIRVLFRLVCGELAVHLARSSDHADKPYLLLRAEKLCVDAARMEYGPAVQASLRRVQLVDKLHKGSSGEYLELISSDNKADMITVLYRKVQADCPEFKSHFHQVEHSLVVDVSGLAVAFHREAFVTIARFLQYVVAKLKPRTLSRNLRLNELPRPSSLVLQEESDPPVPPGATKFSISARLDCLAVRLCDTDLELADLRVAGLEMDYVLKANEKSVLRFDLTELSLEDLLQDTLYKKILSTEGDKVIDMKYVKRSPHQKDMEASRSQDSLPVRVDGSLRLRVGRTVFVLLPTFTNELHRFLEPFLNPDTTAFVRKSTEGKLQQHVCDLKQSVLRYQVSVEVGAPTLLLPQKATSPNALLLNLGQLSVENFFQEDGDRCVDNLLFRLQSLQLARAVILLDGRMEIREPILEPLQLRLDVKRSLAPCQGLLYDVSGSMDLIKVNIGQRDLSSMIAIYQDNYSQLRFLDSRKDSALSPCSPSAATTPGAEESMRKLEVFLYGSTEVKKESAFTFIMEGLQLTLYTDGQDMRSLSVRDPEQALTTFSLDEVSLSLETTNDRALELKCSCQAATLLDVSAPKGSPLCKIFQSYSGDCGGSTGVEGIRLCMPPMVDLTYRQTGSGDAAVDVVVEKIRLNVSVGYLLAVLKFVSDALPGSRLPSAEAFEGEEGGGVSPGRSHRLPSDSTSGYQSTAGACAGEPRALSVSAVFRKPEVVLFAQPDLPNSGVLVLKMDIMLDYSFNLGQGNTVLSVAGLHMLSCVYGRRKHTMCTVLHPCELELNRSFRLAEEDIKSSVMVSSLNLCLSAPVVDTILQVSRQLMNSIQEEENRRNYNMDKELKQVQDLWSPSAVNPQKWADSECWCHQTPFLIAKYSESLTVSVPELQVWCEVNVESKAVPLLYAKAALEADMKDWKTQLNAKGEFRLEAMYYNEKVSCWEPLLEHVLISEGHYRPIEIMFKAFRDRSHPIVCGVDDAEPIPRCATDGHRSSGSSPSSSGNETEEEEEVAMTVIRRKPIRAKRLSSIAKSRDASSLVAFPGDSDSENEDGVLEKIASTFDHLFSDGDGEASDDDEDGDDEPHSDSEGIGADIDGDHSDDGSGDTETADHDDDAFDDGRVALPPPTFSSAGSPAGHHRHHRHRSVDPEETALYLTVDCRDQININVTPAAISVLQEVVKDFTSSSPLMQSDAVCPHKTQKSSIRNLLGPESGITVLEKKEENGDYEVVEESTSRASVPTAVVDADMVTPLVDISPADSDSEMAGDENDGFMMSSSCIAPEKRIVSADHLYAERSIAELYSDSTKEKLSIQVEGFDPLVCLLPSRLTTTMYALQPVKNKTRYFVLVGVEMDHGQRTITVQSPLKVVNSLGYPVHVFCQKSVLEAAGAASEDYSKNPFHDEFIRLTTLAPEASYDVPLLVAYHCKLYFQPVVHDKEYAISSDSVWWKDMTVTQKGSKFLVCQAENDKDSIFCTKVVCIENKNLKTPSVGTKLVPNFSVHLFPPVVLHNFLPLPLDLVIKSKSQSIKLLEGENITFHDVDPQQTQEILLEAGQYAGLQWHGKVSVCGDMEDQHPAVVMSPDADTGGGNRHLQISLHLSWEQGLHLYLFSPYWIVNKTGLPLQFRGAASDHVYDAAPGSDPLLFRFKKHRRKKAKLRVYSSQWSKSFSLDTAGNSGVVVCTDKERNKKYRFFVSIVMSELLLTKIVVVKPFFLVINNTENPLRFMEKNEATDLWFDIAQEKCLPFWPDTESSRMFVKHRDSKTVSQHFPIDHSHVTVLRMECGSAMKVEVKCSEDSPTTIAFSAYSVGDAPVRVDNFCEDLFLKIHQKCQSQVTLLNPYQSVLYTWDDPSEDRTLVWNLYNRKKAGFPARIARDGYGHEKLSFHTLRKTLLQPATNNRSWSVEESSSSDDDSESEDGQQLPRRKTRKDKVVVHWVSYVERGQRVLLFTQNDRVAKQARKAVDGERAFLECFLSLGGLGVSLVSDSRREVAFASLSGCPAIWEIEINHSWKLLTLELSAWLEDKWNADQQKAHLKEYLQVDLTKMQMIKPFFGQLRRFYSPALWLQLRKSPVQTYAHLKVHRFQVDNQLPDAVFPTVFHPGTTPQYVVRREGPKPWMESCVLFHNSKDRTTRTIKFCKVLMQEVHLKFDKGFLLSVHDIYSQFSNKLDENAKLRMDVTTIQKPLIDQQQRCSGYHKKILFEYIHLSPVKVHFSFSPRGTIHRSQSSRDSSLQTDIVDLLLSSVGATLTEVKDVELRMAYFERRGHLSRPVDLAAEVVSHYKSQTIQQAYVMVFGLDILGNPYGLVKDFTRGIGDFFYEPFLGSVKGPDEFASSLARGAQSLLGHVIGGSAGAVSLITGSLGQALSVLSFDEEYRKRRQLRLNQHPDTLPAGLLSAARSFALGVALGLSGVVVQPVTGGQQEGVEGFFRGMGKGLLGLITRPAGGVMDMISMAFDGIRRAAEMGENVVLRMRLPRYIHPTEGLRPYSPYLSSGCLLLELVSKGHYAETDVYWAHASLSPHDRARVALLTDRHVFLLEKCRLWGGWDVEWVISVDDILTVPQRHGNNLVIKVKQEDWILNFAGDERFVQCDDTQVLDWLKDKIEKVLLFNMWDKPCSLKL